MNIRQERFPSVKKWPTQKTEIFITTNSQYLFPKISWIGSWICTIDWCKGHWCGSTYMVLRLSNISSKTGKNAFFVFLGHVGQPLDHIGWATSIYFSTINSSNPKINPWNFHEKILRIGDFEKLSFFE